MFFESKANKHSKFTALIAKNAGVYTVFAMSRKCGRRKTLQRAVFCHFWTLRRLYLDIFLPVAAPNP